MKKLSGVRILIVEDDAPTSDYLREWFEAEDCIVEIASDGKTGLQAFQRLRPDMVLLDINIPGIDGFELLTQIKSEHSETKAIMVTGVESQMAIEACIEAGASSYPVKPVTVQNLQDVVEKTLGLD